VAARVVLATTVLRRIRRKRFMSAYLPIVSLLITRREGLVARTTSAEVVRQPDLHRTTQPKA
jgi:hypothetical protein